MDFEYDPQKSESNKSKHGIDFKEVQALWKDKRGYEFEVESNGEIRYLLVAKRKDVYWTAVFTYRGAKIRIISVRRSRRSEIGLYDNN